MCKAKCYVAFKTEDELRTHLDIEHASVETIVQTKGKVKANALLGFMEANKDKD